jgi:Holliday junction resolvase RusA-like endonuclease
MDLTFRLDVEPKGAKRHRTRVIVPKSGASAFASEYSDPDEVKYQREIATLARPHRPKSPIEGFLWRIDDPVRVDIVAVTRRPQTVPKKKGTGRYWSSVKPDVDNIAKSILDALKDWWSDDKLVAQLVVSKVVAAEGETPHLELRIRTLGGLK